MCLYPGSLHITPLHTPAHCLSPPLLHVVGCLGHYYLPCSQYGPEKFSLPPDPESLHSGRVPGHDCAQQPSQYTLLTSKVCLPDFQV